MQTSVTLLRLFQKLGFDRPKFAIGFQISLVAFASLVVAWLCGLDHPQWAAITVFVTLQPSRGQIIEKSSYRALGTIAGSAFGAAAVWLAQGDLGLELIAVTLWAAAMVYLGSLQRAYRSYGTLLAGYSAIIVVVLAPFSAETVQDVALARVATVGIGALAAVLWASATRLSDPRGEVKTKARRLCADVMQHLGLSLQSPHGPDMARFTRLMSATAQLQDEVATMTANGRAVGLSGVEALLQSLTALMLVVPHHGPARELGLALQDFGERLHGQSNFAGTSRHLYKALALNDDPVLEEVLSAVMVQLQSLEQPKATLQARYEPRRRYALDWSGAAQGALRLTVVLGLISFGWWISGDTLFQYPLVSAAICMALASTGVTPARKMPDVIRGQVAAALVAVTVETLLWPNFPSPTGQLLALILPAVIFAFIRAHRATSLAAPDFAITVFLLLSPEYQAYSQSADPFLRAAMAVSGALLGYLAFLVIFPTDARSRRKALWRMIKRDLQEVTRQRHHTLDAPAWRQSFAKRFLLITHWANQEQGRYERSDITMRKGLVTMQLAEVVFMMRHLQARPELSQSLRRAITAGLERIRISRTDSEALTRTMMMLAMKLDAAGYHSEAAITQHGFAELNTLAHLRAAVRSKT